MAEWPTNKKKAAQKRRNHEAAIRQGRKQREQGSGKSQ